MQCRCDCSQTAGRTKMKLAMVVGLGPATLSYMGTKLSPKGEFPQFSVHVRCGQTAGWIKMPYGMEARLGPGHIVLDGDPAPPKRGTYPQFSAHVCCGQTVAHLSYCCVEHLSVTVPNIWNDLSFNCRAAICMNSFNLNVILNGNSFPPRVR